MSRNVGKKRQNWRGFTIIEVVLVLAIAGLIFLMVFVALPNLQRVQRNAQRKNDVARFMTAIENYQTNNHQKLPFRSGTIDSNFFARYIDPDIVWERISGGVQGVTTQCGKESTDPSGECYRFTYRGNLRKDSQINGASIGLEKSHNLFIYTYAECNNTENVVQYKVGANYMALIYTLEGGPVVCVDNS